MDNLTLTLKCLPYEHSYDASLIADGRNAGLIDHPYHASWEDPPKEKGGEETIIVCITQPSL